MAEADRERLEAVSEALVVVLTNQEQIMRAQAEAARVLCTAPLGLLDRAVFSAAFARGYAARIDALSRKAAEADPA